MRPRRTTRTLRNLAALLALAILPALLALPGQPEALAAGPALANPILFITAVPTPYDVLTFATIFGNHLGDVHAAGRGGDLWIRYPDGSLKNLTQAAGFGVASGLQAAGSIAVRDPSVSWDGTRALFSMVVGAPQAATATPPSYVWQIYEVSGLGKAQTPVIARVPNQPSSYNNITPLYGTDGRVIFTSDRPRGGQAHLYPLLDEYNMAPTNTGLWSLDPATGDLFQLDDSPSGDLSPSVDSFGRVVFTRWDHLERDQQADVDALRALQQPPQACQFCTFNYADESAGAATGPNTEVFPEPRPQRTDLLAGTNIAGHHMNEFLPWQINEDGTAPETVNHIGRHELLAHIPAAFTDDPNLTSMSGAPVGAFNQSRVTKLLQMKEDPANPGRYYGVDALELAHASGQIVALDGPPSADADHMLVTYITHRETLSTTLQVALPHSDGHYRDPLPTSDGQLIAAYTTYKNFETVIPNQPVPASHFDFRLYTLGPDSVNPGSMAHAQLVTAGMPTKTLDYYDGLTHVSFSGQLWELQPVEVRARPVPQRRTAAPLAAPELAAFGQAGVSPAQLQAFMRANGLALIVSRNVTTRDRSDVEQPWRLQVGLSGAMTAPGSGKLYHVGSLQIVQADRLRGMTPKGSAGPVPGRRVLAEPLHDPASVALDAAGQGGAPAGSVALGADGSMAAFVPARQAVSWQLTDLGGAPVVRERVWVTTQPGEIRVCASCHGINTADQAGGGVPVNTPAALVTLLQRWSSTQPAPASLSPSAAAAGGGAFTLTVTGANFTPGLVVLWNGQQRPTHFVSATTLTADVTAADIAAAGSATVTVSNPATGISSAGLPFAVQGAAGASHAYLPYVTR